jgi:hypothetical protein
MSRHTNTDNKRARLHLHANENGSQGVCGRYGRVTVSLPDFVLAPHRCGFCAKALLQQRAMTKKLTGQFPTWPPFLI